jgi:predicted DNA-binding transcriptional regulator YafY
MAKKRQAKKTMKKSTAAEKSIPQRPDRDRRVRQAERLANVLKILELIQSRGLWTTKALAEELECSERTVYRYLDVLKFAGVPYYREGPQQFVRVRPDYRFPILTLTEDEALGQALATVATKAAGLDVGAGASATTRKLEATSAGDVKEILADTAQLVSVLDLKLADHSKHRETIKTIQFALLEERQITGQYESPYEPKPVKLRLHPYRLCLIKNAWYVIGRPTDADEPRTYRAARFKTLQMLDQPADVPEDFDLKEYFGNAWAVFRGEKTYDVEVWFTPEAAKVVTETVWHHTQKVKSHKDGSVTLTFRVDGLEEIRNWILSWAGSAKVVQPAELRDLVVEKLQAALKMQQD